LNNTGTIFGNAVCGQGGNPATAISVSSKSLLTGTKTAATANVVFTAVTPPYPCSAFSSCGTLISNITSSNLTPLATGTYRTNKIDLNSGILTIGGNVVLIVYDISGVNGTLNMIYASQIVILPGGSLDLYITQTASFAGTSIINPPPSPATAVRILGIETTQFSFSKSSVTYAGVYGPGSTFSLDSTSQLYGSVVANNITISGTGTMGVNNTGSIHIDMALASNVGVVY
jgi:hypothetical protein